MAAGSDLGAAFQRNLASTIANRAARGISSGIGGYFERFGRAYVQSMGEGLSDMYERLGEIGQAASLSQYEAARSDRPQYRVGEGRISGGALKRAIASSEYFSYDANGLAFARAEPLNREAKHWARINYSAAKPHHTPIQLRFDGTNIGTYQSRRAIRPLWKIPVPFTMKGSEFHVSKNWQRGDNAFRTIKDSHEPFHFIEAGIQAIANALEREMFSLLGEWERNAIDRAGRKA